MKRRIQTALLLLSVIISPSLFSQDIIRQQSCDVTSYQSKIDSLKQLMSSKGFKLMREASMTMESDYEMPVIMPLTQGEMYQFVFIGDPTSRLYEVRMYDWAQQEVFYKKNKQGDEDGNIINYTYSPLETQYHMMKPVQVNKTKKKGLCGYVMMFKRTS